jgi:hypothetical protein
MAACRCLSERTVEDAGTERTVEDAGTGGIAANHGGSYLSDWMRHITTRMGAKNKAADRKFSAYPVRSAVRC